MKKQILITTLAILICGGITYAITYKDISPQRTEMQEVDGLMQEVEVATPDMEKQIEKTWTEERTYDFSPKQKIVEINSIKNSIQSQISRVNEIIDELTESETALELDIDIPIKIELTEVK